MYSLYFIAATVFVFVLGSNFTKVALVQKIALHLSTLSIMIIVSGVGTDLLDIGISIT